LLPHPTARLRLGEERRIMKVLAKLNAWFADIKLMLEGRKLEEFPDELLRRPRIRRT
jgi:hypothetical protein